MTAGQIAEQLDVSKSTLSGHFNVLKAADLVVTNRAGTTITYSLNTSVVEDLLSSIIGLLAPGEQGEKE